MKKFLTLMLALVLICSLACTASAEETRKITWWVYASGDAPIDTQMVVEAANAYSAEKIGVEVELIFKNEEQFNLSMQTGEPYDMTFTCDWANSFVDNAIAGSACSCRSGGGRVPQLYLRSGGERQQ